ncbi:unnamed protein product [Cuscuta epithymum]|uniref:protein-serine/threonine phosphatase n=1 Tax=Cuscuta epithymum TaxID=186058 RepID=A0AAV0E070_9ASTE|nr:unnamed protein product [Cuscuta epithymum]
MPSIWESLSSCWKPLKRYTRVSRDESSRSIRREDDELLWYRDLEKHHFGDYSFAVVQANNMIEDYSQVDAGPEATFVGVYDGHGGAEAANFICNNLLKNLCRIAKDEGRISEKVLENALLETEEGFMSLVRGAFESNPVIAANGSCCLVGVIWKGTLLVANLGDSGAVVGVLNKKTKEMFADQLTYEHNASSPQVREELKSLHPDDPKIVIFKNGAWRVKGVIQITRSIGDAYLKRQEFALGPEHPRFHLGEALTRPILRSDPTVFKRQLTPDDKFVIFASDGLWEHLTGQRAAEIVHASPRPGIARRLIRIALSEAAAKAGGLRYDQIKALGRGRRRAYHDDITVVVIFVDHHDGGGSRVVPGLQIKGSSVRAEPSELAGISLPGGPSTSYSGPSSKSYGGPSTPYGGESDEPPLLKATVDFGLGAQSDPKGKAKVEEA